MKATEIATLLLDHAAELLDGPSDANPHAAAAAEWAKIADCAVEPGSAWAPGFIADRLCPVIDPVPFTPGPPRPVPPPQPFAHADIARRSIAGDDEDATPRLPSLRGFLAAAAASHDWGVPVRSTCDPERFGKGALRGGGRPHDPCTGREHYALAPARASVGRVEEAVPPAAADAEHGHAGNGTTFTGLLTVAEHPSLSALEGIAKTAWVTRHVNGWLVNYADADGVTRGLIGPSVREVAAVLALNHRVRARSMHIVKGGRA